MIATPDARRVARSATLHDTARTPRALAEAIASALSLGVDWTVARAFRRQAMARPDAESRHAEAWLRELLVAAGAV